MTEKQKSLKLNAFMNTVLTVSTFVFPLITFPYITRVLLPSGTGKIAFANSVVNYFVMIAALGIPTYGIRACAKVRDNRNELSKTAKEILFINIIMTLVSYGLLAISIGAVNKLKDISMLLIICSGTILLNAIGMEWLYKALECYSYIAIRSIIIKIVAVILMFSFVKNENDYLKYAAITVFANAGYGVCNALSIKKHIEIFGYAKLNFKKHLKSIMVFFAMTVAISIYTNIDTTMLGFMRGDVEVGYYDVAIKIKVILVNVVTALGTVLLPRASYYIENNLTQEFTAISRRAVEYVAVISIPLILSFIILADKCILLLSGINYIPSIMPMRIIMLTLFFIGMSNITGIQMLVPLGKEKVVLYSEIAGAITDIILNAALIPKHGVAGASIGTVAAEVVVLLVQMAALGSYRTKAFQQIQYFKIIGGAIPAVLYILILKNRLLNSNIINLIILFGGFWGIYGLVLLLLKEEIIVSICCSLRKVLKRT